jgi:hypothetical protein
LSGASLGDRIKAGLSRSRAVEVGQDLRSGHVWASVAMVGATLVDGLATPLGYAIVWVESTLGWLIDVALAPLALVLAIPYLGRALAMLWAVVQTIIWAAVALPDGLLAVLGVMPEKRLRICVLADPQAGESQRADLIQALGVAARIYRREANIRLIPARPWLFEGAFAAAPQADAAWLRMGGQTTPARSVGCGFRAAVEDIGWLGSTLAWQALIRHPFGIARRILGAGGPVVIFPVGTVDDGRLAGCSLGPLTDYVTLTVDPPVCLAHELGHACNLLHTTAKGNLMNPTCGGAHLSRWQVVLMRLSRHVSYL